MPYCKNCIRALQVLRLRAIFNCQPSVTCCTIMVISVAVVSSTHWILGQLTFLLPYVKDLENFLRSHPDDMFRPYPQSDLDISCYTHFSGKLSYLIRLQTLESLTLRPGIHDFLFYFSFLISHYFLYSKALVKLTNLVAGRMSINKIIESWNTILFHRLWNLLSRAYTIKNC